LTGFVVHRSKVPTFKGVYYINGRMFYIVLSFVGVLLFSGMCRSEMWIKIIIPKTFIELLEEMFGISHKHSKKTAIGGCTAKLGR
jgi:hypothetical protein